MVERHRSTYPTLVDSYISLSFDSGISERIGTAHRIVISEDQTLNEYIWHLIGYVAVTWLRAGFQMVIHLKSRAMWIHRIRKRILSMILMTPAAGSSIVKLSSTGFLVDPMRLLIKTQATAVIVPGSRISVPTSEPHCQNSIMCSLVSGLDSIYTRAISLFSTSQRLQRCFKILISLRYRTTLSKLLAPSSGSPSPTTRMVSAGALHRSFSASPTLPPKLPRN